jgi:hypothetical protein
VCSESYSTRMCFQWSQANFVARWCDIWHCAVPSYRCCTNINKEVGLSVNYPKMLHVMCMGYALHSVCETIYVLSKCWQAISLCQTNYPHPPKLQYLHVREPGWMQLCIIQKTLKAVVL